MDAPDVSYARSGDVAIAYQVVGEGPIDLVFVRGTLAHLLAGWDMPIEFDERGSHDLKGVPGEWRLYAVK
jgi:hypothetical protein